MSKERPDIPPETLTNWQRIVDLIARLADVPATLVMKTEAPAHRVFVTSRTEDNPYWVGREFQLNEKLYCYGVLRNDGELLVEDATCDPDWADNDDMEDGMSFYVGFPLKWPDGSIFGTICVLDQRRNKRALLFRQGLEEFARVIEADLALLQEIGERKRLEAALNETLDRMEQRVAERTRELEEANTALRVLLGNVEETRRARDDDLLRKIKGLVLPHLARLRDGVGGTEPYQSYLALAEGNLKGITSELSSNLARAFEDLTPSEIEIAQLIMDGRTTKDIARALSRETSTIDFHRNNIRKKLGISSRRRNLRTHLLSIH